jgi:endonuclease/exonuclease/phosphatase family metal-dependent hydrolase
LSLKLLSLNIEHDRHLERVRRTIAEHEPDVVCLQEVFESDCESLAAVGDYHVKFALSSYMPRKTQSTQSMDWGIAVLSRTPLKRFDVACYSEDPRIRTFAAPNDPRRLIVAAEIEHHGEAYLVATTHFTWSEEGRISDEQVADFARMQRVLARYADYVLCGDFNAPRGREMFALFTDQLGLIDHLPSHITSTIDGTFHRAGDLNLAVDTVFASPHYQVSEVHVIDGVSDHKAIVAKIDRVALPKIHAREAQLE